MVTFLVQGLEEEAKTLSENIYLSERLKLLEAVADEMIFSGRVATSWNSLYFSAQKINEITASGEEIREMSYDYWAQISILKSGCLFINMILKLYYRDDERYKSGKFFNDISGQQVHPDDRFAI